jgi:hypothetical protein
MNKHTRNSILVLTAAVVFTAFSCTPKLTANVYRKDRTTFNSIYNQYKKLSADRPFSVEYKDRNFNQISLEIIKDTIRYIYKFRLDEKNLADTLDKYQFNTAEVVSMIQDMRTVHCTWINKMDYYVDRARKSIIYMSVREKRLDSWLKAEKYYTIAFFEDRQYYDNRGRLVEKPGDSTPMRINYALYRRITDHVCYAITENFR